MRRSRHGVCSASLYAHRISHLFDSSCLSLRFGIWACGSVAICKVWHAAHVHLALPFSPFSACVQEDPSKAAQRNPFVGLICVTLACLSSGFAGVYFEKILKVCASPSDSPSNCLHGCGSTHEHPAPRVADFQ